MLICILFISSKFKLLKGRALVYFLFCLLFHYMAVIFWNYLFCLNLFWFILPKINFNLPIFIKVVIQVNVY